MDAVLIYVKTSISILKMKLRFLRYFAKLQLVQNAAAKVICGLRKFDRVTPSLYNLHWLLIEQRIIFKILLLVYKARSGEGPKYLKDLLLPYSAHHKGLTVQLRSSDDPTLLDTPSTDKITYEDRSFSYAGTYYWNKLPQVIRELDTLPRFKKELKTYLFEKSYYLLCKALLNISEMV